MTYKKSLSTSTISALHNVGFDRVTLWSHPFINRISRTAVDLTIKNETRLLVQVMNDPDNQGIWVSVTKHIVGRHK